METSTIDRLFLELSQVTKAMTAKELRYEKALAEIATMRHDPQGTTAIQMAVMAKEALRQP